MTFFMTNNEWLADARSKEDDFFQRRDRALLQALRERDERQRMLRELRSAAGIADRDLLEDLSRIGYEPRTAILLELVPLVQVAWSDGSVNDKEREQILNIAARQGIAEDTPAWRRLNECCETRPSDEFFRVTLRALRALRGSLAAADRAQRDSDLLRNCAAVAAAYGGFLGLGSKISSMEEVVIAQIAAALKTEEDLSPASRQRATT